MATSILLGIDPENLPSEHSSTGIDSLGPSDASDSGSDSAGAYSSDSDTDRFGTGERTSVEPNASPTDTDILPDHIEQLGLDAEDTPDTRDTDSVAVEDLPSEDPADSEDEEL